jgi:polyphosphate kinase
MRRNLSHRVEIVFPAGNPKLVRRLKDILNVQLCLMKGNLIICKAMDITSEGARVVKRTQSIANSGF